MKEQLTELINTLYEAEGLVDMALRRNAQPGERVLYLALAKCHEVSRKAAAINLDTVDVVPQEDDAAESTLYQSGQDAEQISHTDVEPPVACSYTNEDENPAEIEKEVEVFTNEVLPQQGHLALDTPDISDASVFDTDSSANVKSASTQPVAARTSLMRAFSINDKYRYRSALFAGNDMLMRDTLAEFEAMAGMTEAQEYCEHTLAWDVADPDVKDFLSALETYYNE